MNSCIREIQQDISIAQQAIAESGLSSLLDSESELWHLVEVVAGDAHV